MFLEATKKIRPSPTISSSRENSTRTGSSGRGNCGEARVIRHWAFRGDSSDTITYYTRDRDTAQNTQYDIGCRSRDLTGEFLLERSYRYVNSRSKIENQEPVDKSSQDLLPGGI